RGPPAFPDRHGRLGRGEQRRSGAQGRDGELALREHGRGIVTVPDCGYHAGDIGVDGALLPAAGNEVGGDHVHDLEVSRADDAQPACSAPANAPWVDEDGAVATAAVPSLASDPVDECTTAGTPVDRRLQRLLAVLWLGFLIYPLSDLLSSDAPTVRVALSISGLAVFVVLYLRFHASDLGRHPKSAVLRQARGE